MRVIIVNHYIPPGNEKKSVRRFTGALTHGLCAKSGCQSRSERDKGISQSKFCGKHYGGTCPSGTSQTKEGKGICQERGCNYRNEKSRGISSSKYCGYHRY